MRAGEIQRDRSTSYVIRAAARPRKVGEKTGPIGKFNDRTGFCVLWWFPEFHVYKHCLRSAGKYWFPCPAQAQVSVNLGEQKPRTHYPIHMTFTVTLCYVK